MWCNTNFKLNVSTFESRLTMRNEQVTGYELCYKHRYIYNVYIIHITRGLSVFAEHNIVVGATLRAYVYIYIHIIIVSKEGGWRGKEEIFQRENFWDVVSIPRRWYFEWPEKESHEKYSKNTLSWWFDGFRV